MEAAHNHSIKVVLDITTHGVVPESPLIEAHREYFQDNGTTGEKSGKCALPRHSLQTLQKTLELLSARRLCLPNFIRDTDEAGGGGVETKEINLAGRNTHVHTHALSLQERGG